jgi:hypothetical protein
MGLPADEKSDPMSSSHAYSSTSSSTSSSSFVDLTEKAKGAPPQTSPPAPGQKRKAPADEEDGSQDEDPWSDKALAQAQEHMLQDAAKRGGSGSSSGEPTCCMRV